MRLPILTQKNIVQVQQLQKNIVHKLQHKKKSSKKYSYHPSIKNQMVPP